MNNVIIENCKVEDEEYDLLKEFDNIISILKKKMIICGCFCFTMGLITGLGTFIWWR